MTFEIRYDSSQHYPVVVYSTSYLNPLQNVDDISMELHEKRNVPCDVLFDLLLSNGEEFNRFVLGHFDGQNIDYNSLKVINLSNEVVNIINKYYGKRLNNLNNSVLTSSQKIKYAKCS